MAEFRKLFYAFGLAALITGASSTASAQTSTICNSNAGVPPIIRAESFSDLVGDYVLDCTGGTRTPSGQTVPQVNFTVTLSTQITSRLLTGTFTEALLIVDEPNSASNPTRPLLACGDTTGGAPDNTASGPGVCIITADGTPTYSGASGHPNVFQGRTGVAQNLNDSNIVVFNGVPFDPPGNALEGVSTGHRYFRFTNIRANAPGVSSTFLLTQVLMNVNVNGSTSVAINNPQQVVASVQKGLVGPTVASGSSFVQCISPTGTNNGGSITFTEGFASSFKTKGFEQMIANGVVTAGVYRYNGTANYDVGSTPIGGVRQNVPGANYNTESGFTNATTQALPSAYSASQPPAGIGTIAVTSGTAAFPSSSNGAINTAGIASQGTRLAVAFRDIPAGVTVSVPLSVNLVRSGTTSVTGVARLVSGLSTQGIGTYAAATSGTVGSGSIVFYEVLFDDPFVIEDVSIPVTVSYTPNLASNLPEPFKTASAAGGFAPYILPTDNTVAWQTASSTLPTPRFRNTISNYGNLFTITKCACNLLFPFVTNLNTPVGNYDTGFAIANTSLLPSTTFGFNSNPQQGAVQFWYYPSQTTSPAVATQCTNTTTPGACPGTKVVQAGETLTYSLFQGSPTWGLDNRAAGFTGYMVVQTQFQYCHGFAYISPQGAGPLTNGMSVGYLGLVLDKQVDRDTTTFLPTRTVQQGEALNQ